MASGLCIKKSHNLVADVVRLVMLTILTFFMLYRMFIPGVPRQLTSTRICIFLLFLWAVIYRGGLIRIKKECVIKIYRSFLIVVCTLLVYSSILILLSPGGSGETKMDEYIEWIVFWGMAFYSFTVLYRDIDEIMHVLLVITVIQTMVIIVGVINPVFRTTINGVFNTLGYWSEVRDMEEMYSIGYASGIACMTSTGSIQMAWGMIAALYFLMQKKNKLLYGVLLGLMIIASTMLSRTGLLIGAVCILAVTSFYLKPKQILKFVSIAAIVGLAGWWFLTQSSVSDELLARFGRVEKLFERGLFASYFSGYVSDTAHLPPLSECAVIGTGYTSGVSGSGALVNIDGGFLRTYSALGLVFTSMYYIALVIILFRMIAPLSKGKYKQISFFVLSLILIGEFKEATTLNHVLCLCFVLYYFINKDLVNDRVLDGK